MSEVDRQLSRAYELIEAGDYREARNLLEPLLTTERDNADVWWMYAHAVEDRAKAKEALENVLSIDPDYNGAEELLNETRGMAPVTVDDTSDDDALLDDFLNDDDFDDALDELDDSDLDAVDDASATESSGGRRTALLGFLFLAIIVIVVVLGFLLLNSGGDDDDDDPQAVADATTEVTQDTADDLSTPIPTIGAEQSVVQQGNNDTNADDDTTDEPDIDATATALAEMIDTTPEVVMPDGTEEVDDPGDMVEPTEDMADTQAQSTDGEYAFLFDALVDLSVIEGSDEIVDTALGQTLLISVCSASGGQLRSDLSQAMQAIAGESDNLTAVDAAGVRLLDCDDQNRPLNVIAVSVEDATALQDGTLTEETFSSRWRPVG